MTFIIRISLSFALSDLNNRMSMLNTLDLAFRRLLDVWVEAALQWMQAMGLRWRTGKYIIVIRTIGLAQSSGVSSHRLR
jgi:hypothetical protein